MGKLESLWHTTAGELVQKLVGDKVEEGAVVAECQEPRLKE